MDELHLFAGAGGGILGGMLLGHRTVCAVEIEPYCRKVLLQRQRDGILPWFPVWDDIRTFDGTPWRGAVDVVCGGFPCTDISVAGKGAGIEGKQSGLWSEMARVIGEVRPRFAFVENSPALVHRGLGRVLGDLSAMGYDARWGIVSAADAGAPHLRKRIWILADAGGGEREQRYRPDVFGGRAEDAEQTGLGSCGTDVADAAFERCDKGWTEPAGQPRASVADDGGNDLAHADEIGRHGRTGEQWAEWRAESEDGGDDTPDTEKSGLERTESTRDSWPDGFAGEPGPGRRENDWWQSEPELGRVAHGVAHRVDRLKAIGNGQVPSVAALAWRILSEQGAKEE